MDTINIHTINIHTINHSCTNVRGAQRRCWCCVEASAFPPQSILLIHDDDMTRMNQSLNTTSIIIILNKGGLRVLCVPR